jgi:hypothetical protein
VVEVKPKKALRSFRARSKEGADEPDLIAAK